MRIHLDLLVRAAAATLHSVLFTSPVQHFATRTGGRRRTTYGPCPKLPPPAADARPPYPCRTLGMAAATRPVEGDELIDAVHRNGSGATLLLPVTATYWEAHRHRPRRRFWCPSPLWGGSGGRLRHV